jgi:hypothetical protein
MRIILWGVLLVALALWLAVVAALSTPPSGGPYVWTVAPATGEAF